MTLNILLDKEVSNNQEETIQDKYNAVLVKTVFHINNTYQNLSSEESWVYARKHVYKCTKKYEKRTKC